jgi:hypothetical protein
MRRLVGEMAANVCEMKGLGWQCSSQSASDAPFQKREERSLSKSLHHQSLVRYQPILALSANGS